MRAVSLLSMPIIVKCNSCGKPVQRFPSELRTQTQVHCCRECKYAVGWVTLTCEGCSRAFVRTKSDIAPWTVHHYCSRECAFRAQRWDKHPTWKGGTIIQNGYVLIRVPNGYKRVHVMMAEKVVGRPLRKGEVVHHINCDPSDNRPSNLLICTVAYHKWLHYEMARRYAREHFPPPQGDPGQGLVALGQPPGRAPPSTPKRGKQPVPGV